MNVQRVHQNSIEQLPIVISFLLFGGLFLPKFAVLAGSIYVVARLIFIVTYVTKGSDARIFGAVLGSGAVYMLGLVSFGYAIAQAMQD
mmetsp:Transcript_25915/g.34697  ORF Transcript_25915/g.34697 Transcript_25915/m.34697 type:complete len:88 (+) Transcript_25915:280-543(+)